MTNNDTAVYIKFAGRGWAVWTVDNTSLNAIPEDEEPYDMDDLLRLEQYLYSEGFFKGYYATKLARLKEM
jgi:hypothetical protein